MKSIPAESAQLLDARFDVAGSGDLANPRWDDAPLRILVVRLSTFQDIEASSPHRLLFAECRQARPDAFIDFSFFPTRRDGGLLEKRGLPAYFGAYSLRAVADFDLVLVSHSYALELVNLPGLFSSAGVRASATERGREGVARPLFVMGGSNALAAGGAFGATRSGGIDSFFDAVFFGEGEGHIRAIVAALFPPGEDAREPDRAAMENRLLALNETTPGFYPVVEGAHGVTVAKSGEGFDAASFPAIAGESADTVRVEIARGCPAACSFCFEGWERKPYRERPIAAVLADARRLKAATGACVAELYCFNFNVHTEIVTLLYKLHGLFGDVKAMSQRIDVLDAHPLLIDAEIASGKRSFTLGVEGISARMRAYYAKSLDTGSIERVVARLFDRNVREIKFFYILSGSEDEADLAELSAFAAFLKQRRLESRAGTRVMFSAGFLVRYPFTPLWFEGGATDGTRLREVAAKAESLVGEQGFEFRLAARFDEFEACSALVSTANGMERVLEAHAAGQRFDSSLSRGAAEILKGNRREAGTRAAGSESRTLSFVRATVGDDYLESMCEKARARLDPGYCLGASCSGCGACANGDEKRFMAEHEVRIPRDGAPLRAIARLVAAKRDCRPLAFLVTLPPDCYGAGKTATESRVLRMLFSSCPEAVDNAFEARELDIGQLSPRDSFPGITGPMPFAIKGFDSAKLATCAKASGWEPLEAAATGALDLRIAPSLELAEGFPDALLRYLRSKRVQCSSRRVGSLVVFSFGDKEHERKYAEELTVDPGDGFKARLRAGRKFSAFDLAAFMDPSLPARNCFAGIERVVQGS